MLDMAACNTDGNSVTILCYRAIHLNVEHHIRHGTAFILLVFRWLGTYYFEGDTLLGIPISNALGLKNSCTLAAAAEKNPVLSIFLYYWCQIGYRREWTPFTYPGRRLTCKNCFWQQRPWWKRWMDRRLPWKTSRKGGCPEEEGTSGMFYGSIRVGFRNTRRYSPWYLGRRLNKIRFRVACKNRETPNRNQSRSSYS